MPAHSARRAIRRKAMHASGEIGKRSRDQHGRSPGLVPSPHTSMIGRSRTRPERIDGDCQPASKPAGVVAGPASGRKADPTKPIAPITKIRCRWLLGMTRATQRSAETILPRERRREEFS